MSWERQPYAYRWKVPEDRYIPLDTFTAWPQTFHDERGALMEALEQFIAGDKAPTVGEMYAEKYYKRCD
jgi:hypothetical protein